jgi:hypothetical protein
MRKPHPGILLLVAALVAPMSARADDSSGTSRRLETDTVIPHAIRNDVEPLGFALGLGTLGFTFAGVGVHVRHSVATLEASEALSLAGPDVLLLRTSRIHSVVAVFSAVRAVPITASLIGLGTAEDDLGRLRSLGLPYVVLGIYDLLGAGISGTNAIRLLEDRRADHRAWTPVADQVADESIEAGGAWAGGMLAIGTIELIVGGLALHGSLRLEAIRKFRGLSAVEVRLVPAPGGALLVGRF